MKPINKATLLLTLSFLIACTSDDNNNVNPILLSDSQRILVVNEGNFGQANGSISLIQEDSLFTNDLIGQANNGISTGDVVQSTYHDSVNSRIFVVSNVESRILVLNDKDFVQTDQIESNLSNPRFMLVLKDKIFVSNWNSDFFSSFVAVFNRADLTFQYSVSTEPGTEKIYSYDGENIFVSNNFTNTIQVFGYESESVSKTINVGNAPNGFESFYGGFINVICQDTFGGNEGYIYEIDNTTLAKTDSIALNLKPNGQLVKSENGLVFSSGTSIYQADPREGFIETQNRLVNLENELNSIYGIGINDYLWVANAKGFTENGEVLKLNKSNPQQILKRFQVGIGPNGFLFLDN